MECCVEPVYKVSSKSMITRTRNISKTIHCQRQPLLYAFFQPSEISDAAQGFPFGTHYSSKTRLNGEVSSLHPTPGSHKVQVPNQAPTISLSFICFRRMPMRSVVGGFFSCKRGLESHKQQNMMVHAQDLELWK